MIDTTLDIESRTCQNNSKCNLHCTTDTVAEE